MIVPKNNFEVIPSTFPHESVTRPFFFLPISLHHFFRGHFFGAVFFGDIFTGSTFPYPFILCVRTFLNLYYTLQPTGPSRCPDNTRVLIGVWWLAVIFATTSFTSHMQASMTIKTEVPRLESVKDIVKKPRITPVIIDGMAFDVFLRVRNAWEIFRKL